MFVEDVLDHSKDAFIINATVSDAKLIVVYIFSKLLHLNFPNPDLQTILYTHSHII